MIGFAAETGDLASSACEKLQRKQVDAIAANRVGVVGGGFDSDDNALSVYWQGGQADIGPASKQQVARDLLRLLLDRLLSTRAGSTA